MSAESKSESLFGPDTASLKQVSGTSGPVATRDDLSNCERISCHGDSLCHPLTIYKGFLVCVGIDDAFFLTAPGEEPVSTWAILPPASSDGQEHGQPCGPSSGGCPLTSHDQPLPSSNEFLLERLKSELSPEGIARLLESRGSRPRVQTTTSTSSSSSSAATAATGAAGIGSRKRKNFRPYRSPSADDPSFSGVQVKMNYRLKKDDLDFYMTHKFCNVTRTPKRAQAAPKLPLYDSQSESDARETLPIRAPPPRPHATSKSHYAGKECASCGVRKTPLWRDAEDGTPLCNACGIRYKKYRVRCARCWNIPRRGLKPTWKCFRCGKIF